MFSLMKVNAFFCESFNLDSSTILKSFSPGIYSIIPAFAAPLNANSDSAEQGMIA